MVGVPLLGKGPFIAWFFRLLPIYGEGCRMQSKTALLVCSVLIGLWWSLVWTQFHSGTTDDKWNRALHELSALQQKVAEANRHLAHRAYILYLQSRESQTVSKAALEVEMQLLLASYPELLGAGIWYEPNVVLKQPYLAAYVFRQDDSVRFTWSMGSEAYDYPAQEWYQDAASSQHKTHPVVWSQPYSDKQGRNIVTARMPIWEDGKRIGVATLDWSLADLQGRIDSLNGDSGVLLWLRDGVSGEKILGSRQGLEKLSWQELFASRNDGSVEQGYETWVSTSERSFDVAVAKPEDSAWLSTVIAWAGTLGIIAIVWAILLMRNQEEKKAAVEPVDSTVETTWEIRETAVKSEMEKSIAAEEVTPEIKEVVPSRLLEELTGELQELEKWWVQTVCSESDEKTDDTVLVQRWNLIREMVEGIQQGHQYQSDLHEKTTNLREQTDQIKQLLKLIYDISDQISLLSLNAAIEANRAGEHGKGFMVVSDNVKELALRTQKSLAEMTATVNIVTQHIVDVDEAIDIVQGHIERIVESAHELDDDIEINAEKEMAGQVSGGNSMHRLSDQVATKIAVLQKKVADAA